MNPFHNSLVNEAIGWLGVLLFLVSYLLLIAKKWKSTSYAYHVCNLLGGFLLGCNAYIDRSFASAFINILWGFIAVYGIYTDKWKRNKPAT
ncbi:hypothetical protein ACFS5N_17285 [Mucilaginibacter ximonensis]|uniref:CBU-0592-like domain-containing protein n=1 Tax=Mucilaginibacter ximonensis TaxID=538021 RepID=A0ABW5YG67_9SPHI